MVKLPRWFWVLAFLVCWPTLLFAQPIFVADGANTHIVLTDEPCTVKEVSNIPYRATWTEKGQDFEGCWAPRPEEGIVLAYFADKTVVAVPIPVFKKVTGV